MLTVVIKDDGESKVTQLTYENLWRELKDMPDAELLVGSNWFNTLDRVKNNYVCFVEADCLVNSGYFASQIGLFKKNPMFRRLAMLSSAVAVNDWHNKFYGYRINKVGNGIAPYVEPIKDKKSKYVYPVQVGYMPGSIINVKMLRQVMEGMDTELTDLVYLSSKLSAAFWRLGDGHRVHINPNTTYVTTEDYVNDLGEADNLDEALDSLFKKELI